VKNRYCTFCEIAQNLEHPAPIYRNKRIVVLRDIKPIAPLHLLLVPYDHVAVSTLSSACQATVMGNLFIVGFEMARREGVIESGYRVVLNQGQDSGQEIEHLHLHLLAGRALAGMG
jgi:histidine triad (HIT) family protein